MTARPNTLGIVDHRETVLHHIGQTPSTVAEIAARAGLSVRCVRMHTAKLFASGLVEETTRPNARPSGAGRRALLYSRPDAVLRSRDHVLLPMTEHHRA